MTSSPLFSTFPARLKIVCARAYALLRQATPHHISHAYAGLSTERLTSPESGPSARVGQVLDTADSCVVVQDAAVEAARSSSTPLTTRAAGEQATTRALPICQHGYYASRCPTCHKEATPLN